MRTVCVEATKCGLKGGLVCLLAVCGAGLVRAYDFGSLKPEGYVSDYSRVLDAASRAELERYCAQLEASTGVQLAFVTVPTLEGEPVEEVANTLFRKWGIGKKGKDEGLLLLLATQDQKFRLEVGYGLEPIIPDGAAGDVLRAMRPGLRAGRYGEALEDAAQQLGQRIAQAKGVSLTSPAPQQREHRHGREPRAIPVGIFLGALGLFWLLSALTGGGRRRAYGYGSNFGGLLPGIILGNVLGRALDHRRSGGGFGGFDSNDSFGGFGGDGGGFGGFGGGDSGGGGASSSW